MLLGTLGLAALFWWTPDAFNRQLIVYLWVFSLVSAVGAWMRRKDLTRRLATAMLATAIVCALLGGALIIGIDWLISQTEIPSIHVAWRHLYIGLVAVGVAALGVRRASGKQGAEPSATSLTRGDMLSPEPAPESSQPVDWIEASEVLSDHGDAVRARFLSELQRLETILIRADLPADERLLRARRTVQQQARRLLNDAAAHAREGEEDVLSQVAAVLEWGVQKVPELSQVDLSDLLMGKVVADIKAHRDSVEHVFIDHRELKAIHPISRGPAIEKCNERTVAAKAALPTIRENGMRLSEDLIAASECLEAFVSITGFQVVDLGGDDGYVTFEGNGRRAALMQAFGEETGVLVEVRLFTFDDPKVQETIARRVRRVRRWKNVVD